MMRRIEIVETCEHGYWGVPHGSTMHDLDGHEPFCPGGSRQPLTVFPPEAVEAAAEKLFWLDHPQWLRQWGWTEIALDLREKYIAKAEAALAAALSVMIGDEE